MTPARHAMKPNAATRMVAIQGLGVATNRRCAMTRQIAVAEAMPG